MLLARCDVWDYADMCTEDIVGVELGIHTFHRKLPKKEEEHPIIRESRRRAERMDKVHECKLCCAEIIFCRVVFSSATIEAIQHASRLTSRI